MLLHLLLLALHLLAAAFWVGGMAAMHFAARSAAVAVLEPPARLTFLSAALTRFFRGVQAALAALFLSGLAMFFLHAGFADAHWRVYAMFGVAVVMAGLFDHACKRVLPALQQAVASCNWKAGAACVARIRRVVTINIGLGVAVFVIATVGRVVG